MEKKNDPYAYQLSSFLLSNRAYCCFFFGYKYCYEFTLIKYEQKANVTIIIINVYVFFCFVCSLWLSWLANWRRTTNNNNKKRDTTTTMMFEDVDDENNRSFI